jgi:hypothetical protein
MCKVKKRNSVGYFIAIVPSGNTPYLWENMWQLYFLKGTKVEFKINVTRVQKSLPHPTLRGPNIRVM